MGNSKNQDKKARQQQNQQQRSKPGQGSPQTAKENHPSKPGEANVSVPEAMTAVAGQPGQYTDDVTGKQGTVFELLEARAAADPHSAGSAPDPNDKGSDQAGMSAEDQERLKENLAPIGGSTKLPDGIICEDPAIELYFDTLLGKRGAIEDVLANREAFDKQQKELAAAAEAPAAPEAPKIQKIETGETVAVSKAKLFEMIYAMSSGHADRYNSQSLPTHLAQLVGLAGREEALEYIRQARLQHAHRND